MRYSIFSLVAQTLNSHRGWQPAWRDAVPKAEYDVLVIGGGGHGLAIAYYLAGQYGMHKVAVPEKGYLGSGNIGRNTTVIRSDYLLPRNTPFYELSMNLWESLSVRAATVLRTRARPRRRSSSATAARPQGHKGW